MKWKLVAFATGHMPVMERGENMTREEAIRILEVNKPVRTKRMSASTRRYVEAFDIAISALSENKGDLISRQKVLETLEVADTFLGEERTVEMYKALLTECIKVLISDSENPNKWIPVSERLPEKNVWVLVTVEQNGNRYQEIMRRNVYIEAWTDNIDNYTNEITAWMPLPEPYKAERGETR